MSKPSTLDGYSNKVTENCERVLVTLLRGLGPWKDSVYLIGGLTPRYLVPNRPPDVPPHAGTGDVDIVVELQMLADTDAYHTLEENLEKMGFERAENERKDAHDLIYCIEHATGRLDAAAEVFRTARKGKHEAVIDNSLSILRKRFADDDVTEGYRKDGPVSVAKFGLGEGDDEQSRETRALRQRRVSDLIGQLLERIG